MNSNQHRMKAVPRMTMPISEKKLQQSEENSNNLESIAESLKQDSQNFIPHFSQGERETLTKITGISDQSTGSRLTAKEKRIIAVQKSAEEFYLTLSMIFAGIPGLQKDGVAIAMQTVSMSESHAACCRKNDTYLEFMEKMFAYSAFAGLFASHAILAGMILKNHGVDVMRNIPGFKRTDTPPEQKEPEFSEEDRMKIMINLMARQEQFKAQLNDGDNA